MMKRLFHNITQTLKKDSGAHFTYNLGVSVVRAGAVILCLAAIVFLFSIIHIDRKLEYLGDTRAEVRGIWRREEHHSPLNIYREFFPKYEYYVIFGFEYRGEFREKQEYITEYSYETYTSLGLGEISSPMHLYSSENEGYYLSLKDIDEAEKEFRKCYHSLIDLSVVAFWLFIISLPVLFVGLGEERLAMKYPRSDVAVGETALVLSEEETDDLMDEFDKEYRKYHRNWAEDPPEYDHPRGDHGNDLFRIEKKTEE